MEVRELRNDSDQEGEIKRFSGFETNIYIIILRWQFMTELDFIRSSSRRLNRHLREETLSIGRARDLISSRSRLKTLVCDVSAIALRLNRASRTICGGSLSNGVDRD